MIKSLAGNEKYGAGHCSIEWDSTNDYGKKVSSGVYFYKIESDEFSNTKKLILLK